MKATRVRHYVSKKGNTTFVYVVNGKDQEMESYRDAQGMNFREFQDDENPDNPLNGKPLYFTTRALPQEIQLEVTTNGNVVVKEDTDEVAAKVLMEEEMIANKIAELKAIDRYNRSRVSKK